MALTPSNHESQAYQTSRFHNLLQQYLFAVLVLTTNRAECRYLSTRWLASVKSPIQKSARVWVSSGSLYIAQASDSRRRAVRENETIDSPHISPPSSASLESCSSPSPHCSFQGELVLVKAKAGHWVTWKSWWAIMETNLVIVFTFRPTDFRQGKGKRARQKDFRSLVN